MTKKMTNTLEEERDMLISETLLRVSCLEKLIIAKTSITQEELSAAYIEATAKLTELMKNLADKDAEDSKS
jgi:hypothetical protein